MHGIRVMAKLGSVTHQAKPTERVEGMKKDRTALKKLDLMVWLDGIWLDGTI